MRTQDFKVYREISLENPTMLAAWPGMGNVALGSVDYLRRKLLARSFAEINTQRFSIPDRVIVEKGMMNLPPFPRNVFYWVKEPPLIIFEGEEQLSGRTGIRLLDIILGVAEKLKVQRIYTGAAFPMPTYHEDSSIVYGVANTQTLRDALFKKYQIKIMDEGQISGLNGLLPGFAGKKGMEAACLLATMPLYAINLPNPRAYKALVQAFERILGIEMDLAELDFSISEMDKKMDKIEARLRETFAAQEKASEPKSEEEGVPGHIMKRIEALFQEARHDRNKAYELKRELDRWGLFESFEDRFLDLFKQEDH